MKNPKGEVSVSNRYIYYYASLLKRIYGFVIRRDGENQPGERYTGRLNEPPVHTPIPSGTALPKPIASHLSGTPEVGEIVLFRFRKRLLLGTCQQVLPRAISEISVLSEDGRRLRFHHTNLIYLSGISTTNTPLKTYATTVRALYKKIDLQEIWDLVAETSTALTLSEIADLYWNDPIDTTRWIALYLHLHRACPYFSPYEIDTYSPHSAEQAEYRQRAFSRRQQQNEERDEFIYVLTDSNESLTEDTLTSRQKTWLEQIQQCALWGRESKNAAEAQTLLAEICPGKKNRQKAAVELLIQKQIWDRKQNLDLLRAEVPIQFSHTVIRQTESLQHTFNNHKKQNVFVLHSPNRPDLALSFRRPLFGGPEFGVHIPDLTALIPPGSDIDRNAAERMGAIPFPDHPIPMLPTRFAYDLGHFLPNQKHPALSIYWRMHKNGRLKDFRIAQTIAINKADLSPKEADEALTNPSYKQHRAIRFFSQLSEQLCEHRQTTDPIIDLPAKQIRILNQGLHVQKPENTLTDHIIQELILLAGVAIGRWCYKRNIPAIYETRDPIENPESFAQIPHSVVRCHEIGRQKPCIDFSTDPDMHHGHGILHYCPITQATTRYTDLIMQRQISHYLKTEHPFYTIDDLNTLRYRMWETHGLIDGLVYRHTRDLILQSWTNQIGHKFRAVVLHLKIHGVFVELLDYPFKTVIYPGHALEVGDEIDLRLTGIDRWKGWGHFTALSSEPQPRP